MPMLDTTPYHERPRGEVEREQNCMRTIFKDVAPVDLVWEAFGGMGKTAQVIRECFPKADLIACDLDEQCVSMYNDAGFGKCLQVDALADIRNRAFSSMWGASLDYNRFTLKDLVTKRNPARLKLLQEVLQRKPRWVQLTDSARPYLHLNWQNYGLKTPGIDEYVRALSGELEKMGLRRATWAGHSRASYFMLEAK